MINHYKTTISIDYLAMQRQELGAFRIIINATEAVEVVRTPLQWLEADG